MDDKKYELIKRNGYETHSVFKCKNCGNMFEHSIHGINRKDAKCCPFCEIVSKNATKEQAQYKLDNKGFTIIDFKGISEKSIVKHTCGYQFSTRITTLLNKTKKTRTGCPCCSHGSIAYTAEYVKNEISSLTSGEYTVLSDYRKGDIPILVKHNTCGNKWYVIRKNFVNKGTRCPCCARIEKDSKSIKSIKSFLDDNNISYNTEQVYSTCRDKRVLPFDLYVKSKNLLIEFDGEQHFHPWRFDDENSYEKLKTTHNHDCIKDDFVVKNSISLLRISYTLSRSNLKKVLEEVILNNNLNYFNNSININNNNPDYYLYNGLDPDVIKTS